MITALKSRTVWTIIVMFLVGGTNALTGIIPADSISYVLAALSALAVYFKLSPSQTY